MNDVLKAFISIFFLSATCSLWGASHHPQDFLKRISGTKTEGKDIVQHYCANCHAVKPLIRLGAPRIDRVSDWMPRVKHGLAILFQHTDEGLNAMPARGGCFECSDRQLRLAIKAMLPLALQKGIYLEQKDNNKNK